MTDPSVPADPSDPTAEIITGHGGLHMVAAARNYGVTALYTLSGAHVFPLYDAAIGGASGFDAAAGDNNVALRSGPLRLIDVRHEATAVFAAEGAAKLTRRPGFAALTAGPGVTNGISAMASAYFNGAPMVVVGGRAPEFRWGSGALQEIDHLPLVAPVTQSCATLKDPETIGVDTAAAFARSLSPRRGPVFVDVPMDRFYTPATATPAAVTPPPVQQPDPDALRRISAAIEAARHPVLVLGTDVWMSGAESAARELVERMDIPVIANGSARGVIPRGDRHLVTRARGKAFAGADLVIVVGTPLDFRLGYGLFGDPPAPVVHIVDSPSLFSSTAATQERIAADIPLALSELTRMYHGPRFSDWTGELSAVAAATIAADADMLTADSDPIHPGRIYGELRPRLTDDTVVIGDGGDFVSFAGRFIEPTRPGNWLDPGPFGCLGTGMGYALAAGVNRPGDPLVLLLGDGAAGFSLMDVDTLVRHDIPVAIVMANNSAWGLEKHPMRLLHGYDVAADLQPATAYHEVVSALGGAGELVRHPNEIGPALDRALTAGTPYLVNVLTDPEISYPRTTTGL
jgi:acetolactate synthase I/II/III large subunit